MRKKIIDGEIYYEFREVLYPGYLNNGNMVANISEKALVYCKGLGLDIGAFKWPLPGSVPVDNSIEENAFKLDRFSDNTLDYVFSSHCLEHLREWKKALTLWTNKLKPGGILFLYLPHESMVLWRRGGAWIGGGHEWIPTVELLIPFITSLNMKVIDYNNFRDNYWSFHIVAEKLT